jgi:CubicO group peptidase (beta-lactamase class C family)
MSIQFLRTIGSAILLLLILIPAAFSQSPSAAKKAEQIDRYIKFFADAKQFSGVVLAEENGNVIFEKAYGLANADFRIPNQLNTRIGIASITKFMTYVITTRLVESGKLSLGDPINKYLPNFPAGEKITVGMLLDHRSGIPHRVTKPDEEAASLTSAEVVERIGRAKLVFEPGTQSLYSSSGYSVLARVLELASGKTYAALLDEYVFRPAGMSDSVNFENEPIMERRAQDYVLSPAGYLNAPLKDYSFLVGAGSVYSTARDVYRFGVAILTGKYGEKVKAGLIGETTLSGNGSTNGHRANLKIDKDNKWGLILVSNLNSGANDLILQNVEAILHDHEPSKAVVPAPVIVPNPNREPTEFAGAYRPAEGTSGTFFEVFTKGDAIYVGDLKLYPLRPDCFFEYRYYGNVCFQRNGAGKIDRIEWVAPGFTYKWIKQ